MLENLIPKLYIDAIWKWDFNFGGRQLRLSEGIRVGPTMQLVANKRLSPTTVDVSSSVMLQQGFHQMQLCDIGCPRLQNYKK